MSKQVDERVVSMQFDNQNFEKNVQTSMSTLDKLKQKLNFSGASKGLDNLNSAAKRVDMSGLSNGVEAIRVKFSALDTMADAALRNITNSAMAAGKKIVSALTIDPVKTGFQEYETQINAIQTILANTSHHGTTLEQVNAALDELNKYADMTIYNFTEMTKNIGTFTAAGLDLDTSVKGIQGIANLAAVSGSTSAQASTAMYQLSQAMAAGTVTLQDWNSVVNASMGGKVFQDAIMKTAEDIASSDEAVQAAVARYKNGDNFRQLLNAQDNDPWLTSEILVSALSKFTKTGAVEYLSDLYDISGESVQELQKLGDTTGYNSDAFNKMASSLAKGDEAITKNIKDVLTMADTATRAATEVKTFTQLWDTIKEAVQSGWGMTWRLIIGDFNEAKELLTGLSDFFTGDNGVITRMSDFRNNLLKGALSNPFADLFAKLDDSPVTKIADKIETITMSLEKYQEVVNDVWRGDYGTSDTGRFELLDKAGYNHKVVQDLVNKGYEYKLTVEDVEASEKKLGVSIDTTSESVEAASKSFENLSDEQLKNAGLTEEEIRMYRDLEEQSKKTGKSIKELVDEMGKQDGRTLLIESFKNAGQGLITVLGAIKDAWLEVFPPPTVIQLYNLIKGLNEFSQKLKVSEESADKLRRVFKGIFSVLHIITTVIGGAFKVAFNIANQVLEAFGTNILDVAAFIGDALTNLDKWLTDTLDFTEAIKKIVPYIVDAGNAIRDWFSGIKDADNIPKYIIEGLVNGLREGLTLVGNAALELGKTILEKVKNFLGIESPSTEFFSIGKSIISGILSRIQSGASMIWEALKGFFNIDFSLEDSIATGQNMMTNLATGIQNGASKVWEVLKNIAGKITGFLKNLDFGTVIAAGLSGALIYSITKFAKAIDKLASPFEGFGDVLEGLGDALSGFGKYMKKLGTSAIINSVKNLVLAIAVLLGAIYLLSLADQDKLWNAVKILSVVAGIVAALVIVVQALAMLSAKFGAGAINFGAISLGLIGIAGALLVLSMVVKRLGSLSPEEAKQGFIGLAGVVVALSVLMIVCGNFVKGKAAQNAKQLGSMMLKISISLLLLVGVIKLIAGLSAQEILKGLAVIFTLELFFAALIAVSAIAGKNASKAGSMLLKMSLALVIMVGVIKLISMMSWDELGKGAVGMLGLLAFVTLMMLITKIGGSKAPKLGGMLLAMAAAMLILTLIVKLISGMKWSELAKGAVGIVFLGAIVAGLAKVAAQAKGTSKMAATLLAMAVAIGILAGIAVLLGMVDIQNLAKGIIAVGALSAMIALMVYATKNATSSVGTIVSLVVAIAIMTGALVALSFIDTEKLLASAGALAAVMLSFALMVAATGALKDTSGLVGKLLPFVGVVAILAAILGLMAALDIQASIKTAGALAILLGTMTAAMFILGKAELPAEGMMVKMYAMSGVLAILAAILGIMAALNVEASLQTAGALAILLGTMTAAMFILGKAELPAEGMMVNLYAMSGVVAILAVILGIMAALNVEASIPTAIALGILLNTMASAMLILGAAKLPAAGMMLNMYAMSGVVAILAVILGIMNALGVEASIPTAVALGVLLNAMATAMFIASYAGPMALSGVGAMALMGLVVAELAVILGLMGHFNVEPSIETAAALSILLISMSASLVILALVGVTGPAALIGIALLAVLIVAIGGLMIGIGALMKYVPQLEEFLDNAIPLMSKIGEAIGSFFGNMVSGFIDSVSDALPNIADNLSDFMERLQPFIDGASKIDPSMVDGVKAIASTILVLTGANILDGIGKWLSGKSTIDKFAEEIPTLGEGLVKFADSFDGLDENTLDLVKMAANAIKTLATAAASIPNSGSLLGAIFGNNDLDTFAETFGALGEGLKGLVDELDGFDETSFNTIKLACDALKLIAETSGSIPNSGGWVGAIVGDNDLDTFADQFEALGDGLKRLVDELDGFDEKSLNTIKLACAALTKIAAASEDIPNSGGVAGFFAGENDLDVFAAQFEALGSGVSILADKLDGFNEDDLASVKFACDALATIAAVSEDIPNSGGVAGFFAGENDLDLFAAQFEAVGTGLATLTEKLNGFDEKDKATVKCATEAIAAMSTVAKGIDGQTGWGKKLFGDNSISTFSEQFPKLGSNMKSFVDNLGTFGDAQIAIVRSAVSAINAFTGLSTKDLKNTKSLNLSGFGDKIVKFAGDIKEFTETMPSGTTISGATSNVNKLLTMTEKISKSDANVLKNFTKSLKEIGKDGVKAFVEAFTSDAAKTDVEQAAIDLISKVISGFESKVKDVENKCKSVTNSGKTAIRDKRTDFYNAGVYLVEGFAAGISESDYKATAKATLMATRALNAAKVALGEHSPSKEFYEVGDYAGQGLVNGLDDSGNKVYNAGSEIGASAIGGIEETISGKMSSVKDGLLGSISDTIGSFKEKISGASSSLTDVFSSTKNSFTDSISGMFSADNLNLDMSTELPGLTDMTSMMGSNMGLSMDQGFTDSISGMLPSTGQNFSDALSGYGDISYDIGSGAGISMTQGFSNSVAGMGDVVSDNLNTEPTIRPVMDLSGVETGADEISHLFDEPPTIRPVMDLSAIRTGIATVNGLLDGTETRIGQLSTMSEAINVKVQAKDALLEKALSKIDAGFARMENFRGDTYNIDGITYDDGSNVANAVKDLVKASRVERRR